MLQILTVAAALIALGACGSKKGGKNLSYTDSAASSMNGVMKNAYETVFNNQNDEKSQMSQRLGSDAYNKIYGNESENWPSFPRRTMQITNGEEISVAITAGFEKDFLGADLGTTFGVSVSGSVASSLILIAEDSGEEGLIRQVKTPDGGTDYVVNNEDRDYVAMCTYDVNVNFSFDQNVSAKVVGNGITIKRSNNLAGKVGGNSVFIRPDPGMSLSSVDTRGLLYLCNYFINNASSYNGTSLKEQIQGEARELVKFLVSQAFYPPQSCVLDTVVAVDQDHPDCTGYKSSRLVNATSNTSQNTVARCQGTPDRSAALGYCVLRAKNEGSLCPLYTDNDGNLSAENRGNDLKLATNGAFQYPCDERKGLICKKKSGILTKALGDWVTQYLGGGLQGSCQPDTKFTADSNRNSTPDLESYFRESPLLDKENVDRVILHVDDQVITKMSNSSFKPWEKTAFMASYLKSRGVNVDLIYSPYFERDGQERFWLKVIGGSHERIIDFFSTTDFTPSPTPSEYVDSFSVVYQDIGSFLQFHHPYRFAWWGNDAWLDLEQELAP